MCRVCADEGTAHVEVVGLSDTVRIYAGWEAISTLFLLASCSLVATNHTVDRRARSIFLGVLITLGLISLADFGNYFTSGSFPELRWVHTISMALTFALAPPLPILIANVIFPERYARPLLVVMGLQAALELATIFGGFVFWVDEANVYHRGPLYAVYMASYFISALYLVAVSIRGSRKYQATNAGVVILILLCLMGGVGIQVFDTNMRTTWPAVIMAVVLYFQFYAEMVLRTDALTKLLNRHDYEVFLEAPRLPCVVVTIDVDNFKHVNDSYGHAYGDVCLKTIADATIQAFGSTGRCYRTGGDEFTAIVTRSLDKTTDRAAELERILDEKRADDPRLPGVSIGSALADASCKDISAVVKAADETMYQNKRARKAEGRVPERL